jgi:uncharacterized RDD family membrane protein YckC
LTDQNPYRAPAAQISEIGVDAQLASLGQRLGAALIDVVIILAVVSPVTYLGGYFSMAMDAAMSGQQVPIADQLLWGGVGIGIFYLIQGYPLVASGQTWGKRVLKIKIVDLQGQKPSFWRFAGRRYLPMQLANMIPVLGGLIAIVNVLLIFRSDRRCGHDLIAGTRVVLAR